MVVRLSLELSIYLGDLLKMSAKAGLFQLTL